MFFSQLTTFDAMVVLFRVWLSVFLLLGAGSRAFPSSNNCYGSRFGTAFQISLASEKQCWNARRTELGARRNPELQLGDRSSFVRNSISWLLLTFTCLAQHGASSYAFEGGVGGLGKTKPETGVTLRDGFVPLQNPQGIVSGEIVSPMTGRLILVQFQSPWPLLPTTSGLEARDLREPESAFVQVVQQKSLSKKWNDVTLATKIISESVLGQQGKFGAYASPFDIKVKSVTDDIVECKFTTYTPSMRESDRQVFIKQQEADNSLVLLVVGTTSLRFAAQRATLLKVVDSFEAVAAPQSSLKR